MLPDGVGKPRFGNRDSILDADRSEIDVGARGEGHCQRHRSIVRAGRLHVEHALDAVDFLLDRRGDRIDDSLRGRSGVDGRNGYRRRRDLRVLLDRQIGKRDQAGQDREQRQDRREDRSVDEKPGKHDLAGRGFDGHGFDCRAGADLLDPPSDELLVGADAALDVSLTAIPIAQLDRAALDPSVFVDDPEIAAGEIGSDRALRDEEGLFDFLKRDSDSGEETWEEFEVRIREDRADRERSRGSIQFVAHIVHAAPMREPCLVCEFEERRRRILRLELAIVPSREVPEGDVFARVEIGVNRVELDDRCEQRSFAVADEIAGIDQALSDAAVDRGSNARVGEIEFGARDCGVGGCHCSTR